MIFSVISEFIESVIGPTNYVQFLGSFTSNFLLKKFKVSSNEAPEAGLLKVSIQKLIILVHKGQQINRKLSSNTTLSL